MSEITLEQQLLLYCTKSAINPEFQPEVTNFLAKEPEINWENFLKLAQDHRVIPLVGRSLQNISPSVVPQAISQQLAGYVSNQTRQSLLLTRELVNILQLLEKEQVLAIPFKGACLAAFAYGKIANRTFSDLDILLHRADIPKAIEILLNNRYRDRYQLTPAEIAERWERHHEWDLIKDNGLVALDLHWGFTERPIYFPLNLDDLQPRLEPFNLVGKQVLSFSATDTLLILCVNGSKECWHKLLRICDIAALISSHSEIDWEQLLKTATQLGSRRMVFLGLILAQELMGTVLPELVLKAIEKDKKGKLLAIEIENRLFLGIDQSLGQVDTSRYYLKMRERWRDRLWYIYHLVKYSGGLTPSQRDRDLISLPPGLSFFYYFLRPLRVLPKYGRSIIKKRSQN
ncbi:nucleotidyltransferase domain-containing protein [Merismopedia glauca]|uniref:Nucleotidyltransferase family protein n=1 Tax=Merismopedia glauca CCAP 1448/3 TaxID=1296344 RepID=A0A2T1C0K4_9CYAN|nr:nucleotidyltransferase family protein [Merismopedia glauca]PSB01653.1 hypothetical protein C7B64_17230 [Merismopedia glauca CCAP 1448/3]